MTERERLIELIEKMPWSIVQDGCGCRISNADKCADYLLEKGVIVPPFKLGDTLYDVTEFFSDTYAPEIYERKDDVMYVEKGANGKYLYTYDGAYIYPEEIGKAVFPSREEAEKALAEKKEDDNELVGRRLNK